MTRRRFIFGKPGDPDSGPAKFMEIDCKSGTVYLFGETFGEPDTEQMMVMDRDTAIDIAKEILHNA